MTQLLLLELIAAALLLLLLLRHAALPVLLAVSVAVACGGLRRHGPASTMAGGGRLL